MCSSTVSLPIGLGYVWVYTTFIKAVCRFVYVLLGVIRDLLCRGVRGEVLLYREWRSLHWPRDLAFLLEFV